MYVNYKGWFSSRLHNTSRLSTDHHKNAGNAEIRTVVNKPRINARASYTLKDNLPLSFARLCITWTSKESSRNVCSSIKDKNRAWMVEIRFSKVYNAMVCSHSFQLPNHSTKVFTWSRKRAWWAGFMSLAKEKPWKSNKKWISFAKKHVDWILQGLVHLHESKLGKKIFPIFLSVNLTQHVLRCFVPRRAYIHQL